MKLVQAVTRAIVYTVNLTEKLAIRNDLVIYPLGNSRRSSPLSLVYDDGISETREIGY